MLIPMGSNSWKLIFALVASAAIGLLMAALWHQAKPTRRLASSKSPVTRVDAREQERATPRLTLRSRAASEASSKRTVSGAGASTATAGVIGGRVVTPDGKGIPGAKVSVSPSVEALSAADGAFRVTGIAPTVIPQLQVSHADYLSTYVLEVRTGREDLVLPLEPRSAVRFRGTVMKFMPGDRAVKTNDFSVFSDSHKVQKEGGDSASFTAEVRSGDDLMLNIDVPGCAPMKTRVDIPPNSSHEVSRVFSLGPGGVVTGKVVRAGSGQPVEADITVLSSFVSREESLSSATTKTGPDGIFRVAQVAPQQIVVQVVPSGGLARVERSASITHGGEADLGTIEVGSAGGVSGRVVRVPGLTPMPNEHVEIAGVDGGYHDSARTDALGRFEFSNLSPGQYDVSSDKYQLHELISVQANDIQDVTLRVGTGVLRGVVLRNQKPVKAALRFVRESGGQAAATVATADDGTFGVSALNPGLWEILVLYSPGKGERLRTIQDSVEMPEQGVAFKTIEVPAGGITGRVVNADGQPVAEAAVLQVVENPGTAFMSSPTRAKSAMTKADGTFEMPDYAPGTYSIFARKNGAGSSPQVRVEVPVSGEAMPVTLKLGKTGTLISKALSFTTGEALPEAWCLLSTQAGRVGHGAQRDRDGVMTITDLTPGNYHVQVSASGYSVAEHDVTIREGQTETLTDVICETGALRWTLQDARGVGVPGVPCRLQPDDPNSIEKVREGVTDQSGLWLTRGIIPGSYTATATPAGHIPIVIKLNIVEQQLTVESSRVE